MHKGERERKREEYRKVAKEGENGRREMGTADLLPLALCSPLLSITLLSFHLRASFLLSSSILYICVCVCVKYRLISR